MPCIIKCSIGISCPSCGMTRAFKEIINLNFIQAFKYNILSIPLFIFLTYVFICSAYDFITNKSTLTTHVLKLLANNYIVIVIAIIATFIFNNV